MRQYYASDKKRREEAKRKHQAEKRMKKMNKSKADGNGQESAPETEATAAISTTPDSSETSQ